MANITFQIGMSESNSEILLSDTKPAENGREEVVRHHLPGDGADVPKRVAQVNRHEFSTEAVAQGGFGLGKAVRGGPQGRGVTGMRNYRIGAVSGVKRHPVRQCFFQLSNTVSGCGRQNQ